MLPGSSHFSNGGREGSLEGSPKQTGTFLSERLLHLSPLLSECACVAPPDTTVILRANETLWPGSNDVTLEIKDQQGQSCPTLQKMKVEACTCVVGGTCGSRGQGSKGSALGPKGIGLLFLGLLMLLREYDDVTVT